MPVSSLAIQYFYPSQEKSGDLYRVRGGERDSQWVSRFEMEKGISCEEKEGFEFQPWLPWPNSRSADLFNGAAWQGER